MPYPLLFKIAIYSHFFKLTNLTVRSKQLIHQFSQKYVLRSLVKERGKMVVRPVKVFTAHTQDYREYRFHINQLEGFKQFLKENYVEPSMYEETHIPLYEPLSVELKIREGWELRDYQKPIVEYLLKEQPRSKLVGIQTGKGKLQPHDAKIRVPNGWTTMGEMRPGTDIIAKDGSVSQVTGVYPQGNMQIYRVSFIDGRSTEVGGGHLWRVFLPNESIENRWKIVDTLELTELITVENPRVYIDLIDPELTDAIDLPIDPYDFGNELAVYNSHDVLSTQEIPAIYFSGSTEQRLMLLQGILDTDGIVGKKGTVSFSSMSLPLAKGIQQLVWSLGGIASITTKLPVSNYNGEIIHRRTGYTVIIRYKTPSDLFRIPQKKEMVCQDHSFKTVLKLQVSAVEPVREAPAQCISINHPDQLYVTDDYIVTHNTFVSLAALMTLGHRVVVIIKPTYIDKWIDDILQTLEVEKNELMTVQGSDQLRGLIDLALTNRLSSKIIIISNRTYQNFINAYEMGPEEIESLGYGCSPEDFFPLLRPGTLLIDEVHQEFFSNFKLKLYTHINKTISLSATLINNNPFIEDMYNIMYPRADRYNGEAWDRYIKMYPVSYQFKKPEFIRTTEYNNTVYSHHVFEQSVIKYVPLLNNYLEMVDFILQLGYFQEYQFGDRAAVYVSSIDLATRMTEYFRRKYSHLNVLRYVEDDPFENCMTADLLFTTILSAGTAVDIEGLTCVILTINILSPQSNIQVAGRLRKISNRNVRFYYTYCDQLPKHKEYHKQRVEYLKDRVDTIKDTPYQKPL